MFATISLTLILCGICAILIADTFAFWHDRTTLGNISMLIAVCFTLGWFFLGVRGIW